EFLPQSGYSDGKEMHKVKRSLQMRCDDDSGRQVADNLAIVFRKAVRKNAKARLDAELLHSGSAGIPGHAVTITPAAAAPGRGRDRVAGGACQPAGPRKRGV